ncbi:MAG: flagellar hook-associated protein FlgK [Desulfovibrio sp.]|nr:flagellar hook-associated protein FlgK [Desulfovibrio sp.]
MLSNLLTIGRSALSTSQAWVDITGNNIANADTEGYTRRYVVQKEAATVTINNNQYGLGSNAEQVLRYFDKFLEDNFLNESTIANRWTEQDNIMATLESIFNEANTVGLSDSLDKFFNSWQKLALSPEDPSVRTSVLTNGQTLDDMFASIRRSVKTIQEEMDGSIQQAVDRINEISKAIAALNKKIGEATISDVTNPNALYDQRDMLVEELATLVDIKTVDNGMGNYRVQLTTGQPLVDALKTYDVDFQGPQAENRLMADSPFEGTINFQGSDDFEYTLEVVKGGTLGEAEFRASIDGGVTWLMDDDGQEKHFPSPTIKGTNAAGKYETDAVLVKDVSISFTFDAASANQTLLVGDAFDIVPKSDLYWIEPTRGPENITPQITMTGTDNLDRVSGGKMTSYFTIRDDVCGRYMDEMDALAKSVVWEVNRLHSQGSGLEKLTYATGQNRIPDLKNPLGLATSGNVFYDKMQAGNTNFYFYDIATGEYVEPANGDTLQLNFDPNDPPLNGVKNFDPNEHSLNDVKEAFNRVTLNGKRVFNADIQDNKLILQMHDEAKDPNGKLLWNFAFGEDTTGLLAALGLNCFFSGNDANSLALSSDIANDYTKISAGRVNGGYEVNEGDNTIANAIGGLDTKDVTINTFWKTTIQTIPEYYAGLVSVVGSDKVHTETNKAYHTTLAQSMLERKESVSGVNLDEEMTNLVKYQSAYKAAAKLITTADEMLGILIGLKQ